MSETNEQPKTQRQLSVELTRWLAQNGARLIVRLQTPHGEPITPYNFIPAGWPLVVDVVLNEASK